MSGLEVLAVVSAVAALVSAFHDGSRIVKELRERRKDRQAAPPTKYLQESLDRGPPAIEEAKRVGLDRFGHRFGVGDHITIISLQNQVIQLQQSVTNHLRPATMDDSFVDFEALVRTADISKMNAVRALQDLYLRMDAMESQTPNPMLTLPSPPTTPRQNWGFDTSSHRGLSSSSPPTTHNLSPGPPEMRNFAEGLDQSQGRPPPSPAQEQKRSSQSQNPTELRRSETSSLLSPSRQTTLVGDSMPELRPRHSSDSKSSKRSSFFGLVKRRSYQSEDCSTLPEESIQSLNRHSMSSPPSSVSVQTSQVRHNGYCKGAYFLQVGLKKESMKLRNQPSGITGQSYFWACCSSKCCFEGPAVRIGKTWEYEENIWTSSGVRFRWSFLAKSHLPTKRVKERKYEYKCMFCEAQKKSSDVYKGIREFMMHVAEHGGERWEESSVHNVKLIAGREAELDEIFDINFTAQAEPVLATEGLKIQDSTPSNSDNPPVWDLDENAIFGAHMWR